MVSRPSVPVAESRLDVLLVPVSGPAGSGEAQLAVLIGKELQRRDPHLRVCVVLAQSSVLAAQTDVPSVLLPDSPTRCTAQILELLQRQRPRLVLFDSSGRRAQLRMARQLGARCIYLYWRAKSRRRALALNKLRYWHALWQLIPDVIEAPLSLWERLKLRVSGVEHRFIGMPAEHPDGTAAPRLLPAHWQGRQWWLLCPGGRYQVELFRELADRLVAQGQWVVLCVHAQTRPPRHERLHELPRLPNAELLGLADAAQHCIVNGGGLLLQVLALGVRPLALGLMRDQLPRIEKLASQQLCVAGQKLEIDALLAQAMHMVSEPLDRVAQQLRAEQLQIVNGLDRLVEQVHTLLAAP